MTLLDHYLERYLDGSITEAELAAFGAMIEEEPDLHRELTERLELRSAIGDDLLEIEVPATLSERVRTDVAGRFATIEPEEEEESRRRGGFLPEMIAGSLATRPVGTAVVAFVLLFMVALAPTVDAPHGSDPLATIPLGTVPTEGGDLAALGFSDGSDAAFSNGTVSNGAVSNGTNASGADRAEIRTASGLPSEVHNRSVAELNSTVVDSEMPTTIAATESGPNEAASEQAGELDADTEIDGSDDYDPHAFVADNSSLSNVGLQRQPLNTPDFGQDDDVLADVRSTMARTMTRDPGIETYRPDSPTELASIRITSPREESTVLRVRFGGTFGSGVDGGSSDLSLDGSAYLAVGLGDRSRIGLEGGSATFRYLRSVPVEVVRSARVAARPNSGPNGDPVGRPTGGRQQREQIIAGMTAGGGNIGGGGTGTGLQPAELHPPRGGGVASGIGSDEGPSDPSLIGLETDPQFRYGPGTTVSYEERIYETETTSIYGLVFYDHTVAALNDRVALNGRIGVGGTDGGLVGNARAYASISTHENISWTVGVGASALQELSGERELKAGYGVNAGLEFGF